MVISVKKISIVLGLMVCLVGKHVYASDIDGLDFDFVSTPTQDLWVDALYEPAEKAEEPLLSEDVGIKFTHVDDAKNDEVVQDVLALDKKSKLYCLLSVKQLLLE